MPKAIKTLFKILLIVILAVVVLVAALLAVLTATEYRPEDVEELAPLTSADLAALPAGQELDVLSWNIGYAGLGAGSDFFMDGGKDSRSADRATVEQYLANIGAAVQQGGYDLVLLQEVDSNSGRTYSVDETAALAAGESYYALNYSCPFVPVPIPPIGKVHSGLLTISGYETAAARRISLPCPFSWPLRIANLKRCLLASYIPIEGSDNYLVLVNLHLEAYDDGAGKIAQTEQLRSFIQGEYEKGNYVIAGGDFNQTFPGSLERYPMLDQDYWTPGVLDDSLLPEGWQFACDLTVPSCRLLNQPYDPADTAHTQYYVIDGFILSPNVALEQVETLDLGFADSDHNPVHLTVVLN